MIVDKTQINEFLESNIEVFSIGVMQIVDENANKISFDSLFALSLHKCGLKRVSTLSNELRKKSNFTVFITSDLYCMAQW